MIRSTGLPVAFQAEFTSGTHTAVADAPEAKGGGGQGFGPHELLEVALATCLTMTAQMSAVKHGFPLAGVRSSVSIDRSIPGRPVLNYRLEFDGPLTYARAGHTPPRRGGELPGGQDADGGG